MGSLRSLRKEAVKIDALEFHMAIIDFLDVATAYYDGSGDTVLIEIFGDYWRVIVVVGDTRRLKAFIKRPTGEIFRPQSIDAPVDVSCGNIFYRDNDLSRIFGKSRK